MAKNNAILAAPLALIALLTGISAGLQRMNWEIPIANIAGDHGIIMTGSFIGTLICLERSVINPNKWWRLLPIVNGSSIVLFLADLPVLGYCTLIAGSAGLLVLVCSFLRRSVNLSTGILIFGAFAWLVGNLTLFKQHAYPLAVKWWMVFLLWTIFGERLELSRMLPISLVKRVSLYVIIGINLLGIFLPFHLQGNKVFAISLTGLATWLFLFDMSRYSIKRPGQSRYVAILLMTGYGWLAITGAWLLLWPDHPYAYDATLHMFFLGFVFSMIFAHAPIIFPGIFRINISLYHPVLYLVFILFQLSLCVRITGDAVLSNPLRQWGAMCNGISILTFFITTAAIVISRNNKKEKIYDTTGK